jgi:polar amino acid transport system substrate-binding protein
MIVSKTISALALAASIFSIGLPALAADVPAPGVSARVDAIKKAGVLRVGVLANTPWLVENTTGSGDAWQGPAWLLAQEYAKELGVKLQPIPVSHETKVPVLASNQVDLSITPLAETPERLKVVDFVLYSKTAVCVFGLKNNKKFADAATVDAVNSADFTVAYFIGGAEENWVKERFPNAKLRGVTSSSAPAPIEEIMAKRADAAAINRIQWVLLSKKVPGLTALPKDNNCQDSTEKAAPVGLAIDKGQGPFLDWLRAVEKDMQPKLNADEARIVDTMK